MNYKQMILLELIWTGYFDGIPFFTYFVLRDDHLNDLVSGEFTKHQRKMPIDVDKELLFQDYRSFRDENIDEYNSIMKIFEKSSTENYINAALDYSMVMVLSFLVDERFPVKRYMTEEAVHEVIGNLYHTVDGTTKEEYHTKNGIYLPSYVYIAENYPHY